MTEGSICTRRVVLFSFFRSDNKDKARRCIPQLKTLECLELRCKVEHGIVALKQVFFAYTDISHGRMLKLKKNKGIKKIHIFQLHTVFRT